MKHIAYYSDNTSKVVESYYDIEHNKLVKLISFNSTFTIEVDVKLGYFKVNGILIFPNLTKYKDFELIMFKRVRSHLKTFQNQPSIVSEEIYYALGLKKKLDEYNIIKQCLLFDEKFMYLNNTNTMVEAIQCSQSKNQDFQDKPNP
jgi:hypothetical protein